MSDAERRAWAELTLGRAIVGLVAAEPDVADCADKQTRSLMVAGVALTAMLRAANDRGLNKLSMIEGLGIALGLISGAQPEAVAAAMRDALDRGWAVGLSEAADGVEAAPVLAICVPDVHKEGSRKRVGIWLRYMLEEPCEQGAPLKDVMRRLGVAPPLRRLVAYALAPGYYDVVKGLSAIDPRELGNMIPATPGLQKRWLAACGAWRSWARTRHRQPADSGFEWAARTMAAAEVIRGAVHHVADFRFAADEPFNEAWGWPRAEAEAHAWHGRLTIDRALAGTPFTRDTPLDIARQPDRLVMDGLEFLALRTPMELCDEGSEMRHCVASYVTQVANGVSHVSSIRQRGRRVATLELDKRWNVVQCRGRCNAAPGGEIMTAASHYAFELRRRLGDRAVRP